MNNASTFREELVNNIFYRLDENLRMIRIALAQITEEEMELTSKNTHSQVSVLILILKLLSIYQLNRNKTGKYYVSLLKSKKITFDLSSLT